MIWIYIALSIGPAVCFYKYINRDDDGFSSAITWAFFVAVAQVVLIILGGPIAISIAVLIAAFGAFLGYGAWYMPRLEEMAVIPNGESIVFNYIDRIGRGTKRQIVVSSSDNNYFEGYCSTRKARRTFRRSRVRGSIVVESTGEIIDPMAPAHPELHKK